MRKYKFPEIPKQQLTNFQLKLFLSFSLVTFSVIGSLADLSDGLTSNIPIVAIQTAQNATITDEPKVAASMYIIDNGSGKRNSLSEKPNFQRHEIGIELRGNSTQSMPKKPYIIEIRDNIGNDLDVAILGMAPDNEWILLPAYIDRTQIRTSLAHHLSRALGEWSSNSKHCELVVNSQYMGVYLVIEKIQRTKSRLNLNKLNPEENAGEGLTGGYIYEVTGFGGDMGENRLLHYPKSYIATSIQFDYITDYDNQFRQIMAKAGFSDPVAGYESMINPASFVDELIVQECMRNSDAYGWSGYYHKNKNEKLHAGPVWDFDQSSGNSVYLDGAKTTGWIVDYGIDMPFYWRKLFYEPRFKYEVRKKWEQARLGKFKTENVMAFIDSCANYLGEAQVRNFQKWPILGTFTWRETAGYASRNTYQKEVDYLKNYIRARFAWIDEQLKTVPVITYSPITASENEIRIYPNPAHDNINVEFSSLPLRNNVCFELLDQTGRTVFSVQNCIHQQVKSTIILSPNVSPGIYLYKLTSVGKCLASGKIVIF